MLPRGLGRVYQDPWGGYSATPRVCSWIFRGGAEKTGRGLEMEREERNINEKKIKKIDKQEEEIEWGRKEGRGKRGEGKKGSINIPC